MESAPLHAMKTATIRSNWNEITKRFVREPPRPTRQTPPVHVYSRSHASPNAILASTSLAWTCSADMYPGHPFSPPAARDTLAFACHWSKSPAHGSRRNERKEKIKATSDVDSTKWFLLCWSGDPDRARIRVSPSAIWSRFQIHSPYTSSNVLTGCPSTAAHLSVLLSDWDNSEQTLLKHRAYLSYIFIHETTW